MPTIAELRAATQPASIFERNSGEHWAGRLYMRRVSPYLTRALVRTPISANGVTWLMIGCGLAAAAVLTLPGVAAALGAVLLIQLQLLLDCSDGEVARWRAEKSTAGVYLDRIGHWLTEAALPIALGDPRGRRLGLDRYVHDARSAGRGVRAADQRRVGAGDRGACRGRATTGARHGGRGRTAGGRSPASAASAPLHAVLPGVRGGRGDGAGAGGRDRRRRPRRPRRLTLRWSSRWS